METQRGRAPPWRDLSRLGVGVLFLVGVVVVVLHLGDARRFAELLERARPAWLIVAVLLQAGTYFCAAGIWWVVLRRTSRPQPLRALALLAVGKLFTDQTVPSGGLSGSAFMIRAIARRHTPLPGAMAAFVVSLCGFYAATIACAAASLVLLWTHHDVNVVLVVMSVLLLGVAVAVCSSLVVLVHGDHSRLRRWLGRVAAVRGLLEAFAEAPRDVLRDRVALGWSFVLQVGNIVLDAATLLAALHAVGEHVPAPLVFASFTFAMVAEITGIVPGGLGTFEGTCIALLRHSGAGLEAAFAATMLLRGFTFWLPMVPGVVVVRRELRHA